MIKPTVGRKIHFWPAIAHLDALGSLARSDQASPLDASIAYVWNDRLVNISFADQNGKMGSATSIRLLQDDDKTNAGESFCTWMPYQVGQAEKTKEAVDQLAAAKPSTDDAAIEQEIQAKGKTAARVTPQDIEDNISTEHYFTAGEGIVGAFAASCAAQGRGVFADEARTGQLKPSLNLLTFCVLTLHNGFTVTGESACASPENFDAEIGRKIARANAVQKIWPLMGYELRTKLAAHGITGETK